MDGWERIMHGEDGGVTSLEPWCAASGEGRGRAGGESGEEVHVDALL